MIANLLSNAVKFTEHGEIVLALAIGERSESDLNFFLSVRDTGIGIPHEARERIFEHFLQADGSTTRKYGGTGLGLTICRRLLEMMGGRLSLESSPGAGLLFPDRARPAARASVAAGGLLAGRPGQRGSPTVRR